MFENVIKKSVDFGGRVLTLEVGKIARQALGAVVVNYGGTTVLCSVTSNINNPVSSTDFLPLSVQFISKGYATGKIPGGFFKREGKPSDREVLISRLIDRPIRPLIHNDFYHNTNIFCNLLAYNTAAYPDVPALIGSAAALLISGLPFREALAGIRLGLVEDQFIINPSQSELVKSDLDLILAGTESSILMVESEANQLPEEKLLEAIAFGHTEIQPVINLLNELKDEINPEPLWFPHNEKSTELSELEEVIKGKYLDEIKSSYAVSTKKSKTRSLTLLKNKIIDEYKTDSLNASLVNKTIKNIEQKMLRENVLKNNIRIDGRKPSDIRKIESEVGMLGYPVHGDACFTRGETQAIVITTLGTSENEQITDDIGEEKREHFMLHYNFPPYCVGEAGSIRHPGRREVGHGKLAWHAIRPVLPNKADFPYTIRIVSEITESDGSSSMATVCGSTLSLMDSGVPISTPVSGIAMGLIKDGDEYVILSDILGDEDCLGDMDFKVAGTASGITALQMDIKIDGISSEIILNALNQAKEGRLHILDRMMSTISASREEKKGNSPKISVMNISRDSIPDLIGAGGKTIKEICEVSGAKIDISQQGKVTISATATDSIKKALTMVDNIVSTVKEGRSYLCIILRITTSGMIVKFLENKHGIIPNTEIPQEQLEIIKEGDQVKSYVKFIDRDNDKIILSMHKKPPFNRDKGGGRGDSSGDRRPPSNRDRRSSFNRVDSSSTQKKSDYYDRNGGNTNRRSSGNAFRFNKPSSQHSDTSSPNSADANNNNNNNNNNREQDSGNNANSNSSDSSTYRRRGASNNVAGKKNDENNSDSRFW